MNSPILWLKLYIFCNVHFYLDCMTLLGNVHILCIVPKEIMLIGKKFENRTL
jgi:hypothetical protein